jgi:hypothetical protein
MSTRVCCALTIAAISAAISFALVGPIQAAGDSAGGKKHKKKICPAQSGPHGSFGMGLNSLGLVATIRVAATVENGQAKTGRPYATFPLFGINPFICEALGVPVEIVCTCLMTEVSKEGAAACKPVASPPDVTCPYLKEQQCSHTRSTTANERFSASVLEKLQQLQQARKLCREAEYFHRLGQNETAIGLYERARQLCPGSRVDEEAQGRLQGLRAPGTNHGATPGGEEQEIPRHTKPRQSRNAVHHARVEKRVGRLLLASHKALLSRDYYHAEKLVDTALKLDADCVAEHPLVYKMHLLSQVQEHLMKGMPTAPKPPKNDKGKKDAANQELPARQEGGAALQTSLPPLELPPLDPQVVAALDRVLVESSERPARPLVVVVQGGNEEDVFLAPGSAQSQEAEVPTLVAVPPQADLTVLTEEQEAGHSANEGPAALPANEFWDQLVIPFGGGFCIDVDSSRKDGWRGKCELQAGGFDLQFSWRENAPHLQIIDLTP